MVPWLLHRSGHPAKIPPKAPCKMLSEVKKNPRVTTKDLKDSLELVNISVHESTICKTLNSHDIPDRTPRRKPLLSKNNIAACLKFAKGHLDTP